MFLEWVSITEFKWGSEITWRTLVNYPSGVREQHTWSDRKKDAIATLSLNNTVTSLRKMRKALTHLGQDNRLHILTSILFKTQALCRVTLIPLSKCEMCIISINPEIWSAWNGKPPLSYWIKPKKDSEYLTPEPSVNCARKHSHQQKGLLSVWSRCWQTTATELFPPRLSSLSKSNG